MCQKSESSNKTSFSMLHISNAPQIFKISAFSKISRLLGIFSIPRTPSSSSLPTLPTFPNFQYFQCYRCPGFIYCTHNALKTLPLPLSIFLRKSWYRLDPVSQSQITSLSSMREEHHLPLQFILRLVHNYNQFVYSQLLCIQCFYFYLKTHILSSRPYAKVLGCRTLSFNYIQSLESRIHRSINI